MATIPLALTSTSLYRKITMPSILYGSELWYICHWRRTYHPLSALYS